MIKIQTGKQNEILRKISEEILAKDFDKYIKIGKEMVKFIKNPKNSGVGLALPQIGENKRLIVVSLLKDREDENFKTVIMINPEILEHSQELLTEEEGCLSIPGEKSSVKRFKEIKLKYFAENKKETILVLSGVSSRIVQHEIDHLNGILFTDY